MALKYFTCSTVNFWKFLWCTHQMTCYQNLQTVHPSCRYLIFYSKCFDFNVQIRSTYNLKPSNGSDGIYEDVPLHLY